MEPPKIVLGNKEYTARKLKMKHWRATMKLQKDVGRMTTAEAMMDDAAMDKMANLIAVFFNHPEITPELILEEMDLADFVPTIKNITTWVTSQVNGKIDEFPKNSQTTAGS